MPERVIKCNTLLSARWPSFTQSAKCDVTKTSAAELRTRRRVERRSLQRLTVIVLDWKEGRGGSRRGLLSSLHNLRWAYY